MQIPIINGIYTDFNSDFRTAYPRNYFPVIKEQGISNGYLRPADGISLFGVGPGINRGGINWNETCYRAMGQYLVSIDSNGYSKILGSIGTIGNVIFDYSFDRLAIASDGNLYYYFNGSVQQVTDPNLGVVKSMVWVDGYFMVTDGQNIAVTELNDPFVVDPLKYGSAEADPDPIVCLLKLRNEIYAVNRHSIEIFQNVGGENFPFQRLENAQMRRGAIGTFSAVVFMENIAFLGSGRNEAPAIWIGNNGATRKISTREIDIILTNYNEDTLSKTILEVRVGNDQELLYIHLIDQTLVFDGVASRISDIPIWYSLDSNVSRGSMYRGRNFVWCYDKWLCGDPISAQHGFLDQDISSHYGQKIGWEINTPIIYNESNGAIFSELELVAITGNTKFGVDPTIWTSYSLDGKNWSQEHPRSAGKTGENQKRINWFNQGIMRNYRIQKFRGTSDAHLSLARLQAQLTPLIY